MLTDCERSAVAERTENPVVPLDQPLCLRCSKRIHAWTEVDGCLVDRHYQKNCDYCAKVVKHACHRVSSFGSQVIRNRSAADFIDSSGIQCGGELAAPATLGY
jgi:hypothetical protein